MRSGRGRGRRRGAAHGRRRGWRETDDHGCFVWHDLLTTDIEAAAAGLGPHWLGYVGTADVAATVAQAERLGGRVLAPAVDVPSVGRYAVVADPQGAAFAAFRPAATLPDAPRRGRIDWHQLATTDPRAAFAFYAALFGWAEMGAAAGAGPAHGEDPAMALVFGRPGGPPLGVIRRIAAHEPGPAWLCYTRVEDVGRVADDATRNGGRVIAGPAEAPGGGRVVVCVDPQGARFGAVQ